MRDLARHASSGDASAIAILATPQAGSSELLKQTYDRLFLFQDEVIPFYFAIKSSDENALECAHRFARDLAAQAVAFRRHDSNLQFAGISLSELSVLATPENAAWVGRLAEQCMDGCSTVGALVGAPIRAKMGGVRVFPIIDDLHELQSLEGGEDFRIALVEMLERLHAPSVVCGHRRYLFAKTPFETLYVERLSSTALAEFIESTAARYAVNLAEHTRDLMAVQLEGNLRHTEAVISRAAAKGIALNRFADFVSLYGAEIFGGATAHWLDRVRYDDSHELADSTVARDYVAAKQKLNSSGSPRARVVGEALLEYTTRAPRLMGRHYRRLAALDLRTLLSSFDGREIPASLLDYADYKRELKGRRELDYSELETSERITLPQIVYSAHGEYFYPQVGELIETERIAVGFGIENEENIVWIAAEIDSKLEADADLTELWCDRLEMLGATTGFKEFRIWLIAPEGFDHNALALLSSRNANGSARKQVETLQRHLLGEQTTSEKHAEEYELVIPMGEDTEIVAAHTLEQMARRHDFPTKAITQMKTALVEACINAAEHSLSPDRKIYQKFSFAENRATITVSNRGLRLTDKLASADMRDASRRGWGLKLIKSLMDEVTIDETDDGTRLTMTKHA